MLRLLLVLCFATFTIPRTVGAAVELKGASFSGQAFASIDLYAAPRCLDDKARGIYYQGPVSLEFNTRVEHPSCEPGFPLGAILNVRFSLVTLDSASIDIMDIEPETRRQILRMESIGYSSGRWPLPSLFGCHLADFYYWLRFPELGCDFDFRIQEFTSDGNAFRLTLAPFDSADKPSIGGVALNPTGFGLVTLSGQGIVPTMKSTWGMVKQQFDK
jgi:hypothetical protein